MQRRLRQKAFRFNKNKAVHNRVPVFGKAELWTLFVLLKTSYASTGTPKSY